MKLTAIGKFMLVLVGLFVFVNGWVTDSTINVVIKNYHYKNLSISFVLSILFCLPEIAWIFLTFLGKTYKKKVEHYAYEVAFLLFSSANSTGIWLGIFLAEGKENASWIAGSIFVTRLLVAFFAVNFNDDLIKAEV